MRTGSELIRVVLLAGAALWLSHPFFSRNLQGTPDAQWYANNIGDALEQFRAGVFPYFVGQSDFLFNGSVYPSRAAPALQYTAGWIDLLTGRQLDAIQVLHAIGILNIVAGVLTCYACLVHLAPRCRWAAAALAFLYGACPGVLGIVYSQDLYMSFTTLPWVPLAVYGATRTLREERFAPVIILAAALAALWWCHSPIALWTSALCLGVQVFSWHRHRLQQAGVGAAVFGLLAAYPFISVTSLRGPDDPLWPYEMSRAELIRILEEGWSYALRPLDPAFPSVYLLQIGYALALVGLFGAALGIVRAKDAVSRRTALALAVGSTGIAAVLFPVPGFNRWFWENIHAEVVGITFYWPMQRLYVVLAAVCATLGILGVNAATTEKNRYGWAQWLLAPLVIWSGFQAHVLMQRYLGFPTSPADMRRILQPESIDLQKHAYGLFPRRPAYFTHGTMDPRMEQRLRSGPTGAILADNHFIRGDIVSEGVWQGRPDANPGILLLQPQLVLKPGERYVLRFDFGAPATEGVLRIQGDRLYRSYPMPSGTEAKGFGSGPQSRTALTLWTSDNRSETVEVAFIPTGGPPEVTRLATTFGRFSLERVRPETLPIRVKQLVPHLVAEVTTPGAALLETSRMSTPGYNARVNGSPVEVVRTDEGLVGVPVPAGSSTVELRFIGSSRLRLAFALSALSWFALAGLIAFWSARRVFLPRHSPAHG